MYLLHWKELWVRIELSTKLQALVLHILPPLSIRILTCCCIFRIDNDKKHAELHVKCIAQYTG